MIILEPSFLPFVFRSVLTTNVTIRIPVVSGTPPCGILVFSYTLRAYEKQLFLTGGTKEKHYICNIYSYKDILYTIYIRYKIQKMTENTLFKTLFAADSHN